MPARLEEIKNGASVRGVASAQPVHVLSVDWIGDQAINVVFRDHNGTVSSTRTRGSPSPGSSRMG